jgi:hypothetical protein
MGLIVPFILFGLTMSKDAFIDGEQSIWVAHTKFYFRIDRIQVKEVE